jgi:DNA-binding NarL/FixJ family response regulator
MPLTERQAEVVERVAHGKPDKVIARELRISIDTVRAHIQQAASRVPGNTAPRHRLTLWFFSISSDDAEKKH